MKDLLKIYEEKEPEISKYNDPNEKIVLGQSEKYRYPKSCFELIKQ